MRKLLWKEVEGFERYLISYCGRVWDTKQKRELKQWLKSDGYKNVTLFSDDGKKNHRIHRLVAAAFIDNPHDHPVVDHIDRNRKNNHGDNLRWCDYTFNNANKENKYVIDNEFLIKKFDEDFPQYRNVNDHTGKRCKKRKAAYMYVLKLIQKGVSYEEAVQKRKSFELKNNARLAPTG